MTPTIFDLEPVRTETGDRTIKFRWLANRDSRNYNDEPAAAHLELSVFHHNKRFTAQLNVVHTTVDAEFREPFGALTVAVEAAPRYNATALGVFADRCVEAVRRMAATNAAVIAMADKALA